MTIEICVILVSFRLSPYRSLRVTRTVPNRTVCERGPRERDEETSGVSEGNRRRKVNGTATRHVSLHLPLHPYPLHS